MLGQFLAALKQGNGLFEGVVLCFQGGDDGLEFGEGLFVGEGVEGGEIRVGHIDSSSDTHRFQSVSEMLNALKWVFNVGSLGFVVVNADLPANS